MSRRTGSRNRWTIEEGLERRLISPADAKQMREAERGAGRLDKRKSARRDDGASRLICSVDGDLPQEKIYVACCRRWPGEVVWEMAGVVPGRNFRADIAFPQERLLVEMDGYGPHMGLAAFKHDRDRRNLLVICGWRVLHYYTERVKKDLEGIVEEIALARASATRPLDDNEAASAAVQWRNRIVDE